MKIITKFILFEEPKPNDEPDLSVLSPKYKRVLHGENDRIGPSKSYEEESVLEEFSQFYKDEPPKRNTKQRNNKASKDTYRVRSKSPEAQHQSSSPRVTSDEKRDQVVDDYLVPYHRTETAEMYDNHQQDNTTEQPKPRRKKKEKNPAPVRESFHSDSEDEPRPVKQKTKSKQKATKSKCPAPVRSNRPTSWTQQVNNNNIKALKYLVLKKLLEEKLA